MIRKRVAEILNHHAVSQPVVVPDQRAAGLRFGDRRVLALMHTLCLFVLSPTGFRHRDVRAAVAQLLGRHAERYAASQMTYDLRRLRLHGLIERVPDSHRYRIIQRGPKIAMLSVRLQFSRAAQAAEVAHAARTGRSRAGISQRSDRRPATSRQLTLLVGREIPAADFRRCAPDNWRT